MCSDRTRHSAIRDRSRGLSAAQHLSQAACLKSPGRQAAPIGTHGKTSAPMVGRERNATQECDTHTAPCLTQRGASHVTYITVCVATQRPSEVPCSALPVTSRTMRHCSSMLHVARGTRHVARGTCHVARGTCQHATHGNVENVRLNLQQKIIPRHAACRQTLHVGAAAPDRPTRPDHGISGAAQRPRLSHMEGSAVRKATTTAHRTLAKLRQPSQVLAQMWPCSVRSPSTRSFSIRTPLSLSIAAITCQTRKVSHSPSRSCSPEPHPVHTQTLRH